MATTLVEFMRRVRAVATRQPVSTSFAAILLHPGPLALLASAAVINNLGDFRLKERLGETLEQSICCNAASASATGPLLQTVVVLCVTMFV